jgi:murein DD-endopeptidase MepM/ murein hydrolase activator NlpD
MRRRALLAAPALLLAREAAALELPERAAQGGFVTGRAAPGTRLMLEERAVRVAPDGFFAFGLSRDHGPEALLRVTHPGGRSETRRIAVARREWNVQRIDGLPERMVTPNEADLARIRAEQARVAELRRLDTPGARFADGFAWPVRGRISGVFGSQRVLNGEPRAPHLGIDIAAPTGTPCAASAPGRVLLAADLYFNGLTLILDHGHGVQGTYSHLSRFLVREGQEVERGAVIAEVGATGRVTGPHLDYRINWFATPVDPIPLLPPL